MRISVDAYVNRRILHLCLNKDMRIARIARTCYVFSASASTVVLAVINTEGANIVSVVKRACFACNTAPP